jgi:hypothetical protein
VRFFTSSDLGFEPLWIIRSNSTNYKGRHNLVPRRNGTNTKKKRDKARHFGLEEAEGHPKQPSKDPVQNTTSGPFNLFYT